MDAGAGPQVGIIGAGVPIEMVIAAKALPLRILPAAGPTPRADAIIGGESAEVRALYEAAIAGRLAHLRLLVVTRQYEWLYYFLKEAVRRGDGDVPPLHIHDLIASTQPSTRRYNRQRLDRLAAALTRATGNPIDDGDLFAAIDLANTCRAGFRHLQAARDAGRASGTAAVRAVIRSATEPPQAFADSIGSRIAALPAPPAGPRLLMLGSIPADTGLHAAIEASGVTIVAEDSEWGSRSAVPDIAPTGDPLETLLDATLAAASGPDVTPRSARLGWGEQAIARRDIDAIIFAMPRSDHRFGWDYPTLRDCAAAYGKPALVLRDETLLAPEAITNAVSHFKATLDHQAVA